MARLADVMRIREGEILKLMELVSRESNKFEDPKLILIGGYGLRAFVPFSRSTRDCDFTLKKEAGWKIDEVKRWFGKEIYIETFEKKGNYGYLRCIKPISVCGKTVKVSLDFMEGEVTGRGWKDVVRIDERFVSDSRKTTIMVAGREVEVRVPSYSDFFILKVVSARASDVRDIATLVWKNGVPKDLKRRVSEIVPDKEIFAEKISKSILPIMRDKSFINSWRGMFMTTEFNEEVIEQIIEKISKL